MVDPRLLIEMDRRRAAAVVTDAAKQTAAEAASQLRSIFADHPKQAAFFRRVPHGSLDGLLRATTKTRRAGATVGGVREFLARAIEQPAWRGTYATTTRKEAFERAWENDSGNGFAQVLRAHGKDVTPPGSVETIEIGGVRVELRVGGATEGLTLTFSNGSKIDLYGAENLRMLKRKRGAAPHVVWVDEAQDFPLLDVFYKGVVAAGGADKGGECWFTGTPGRDCAGMFYEITASEGESVEGWEVHTLAAVDNPFFGRVVHADGAWFVDDNLGVRHGPYDDRVSAEAAAVEIRWENAAGRIIRQNKWSVDDPDVQREFFGKWVRTDARYVYPVYAVPDHVLLYAPPRTVPNVFRPEHALWLDIDAALADLPFNRRARRHHQWLFAVGVDFGFHPDPFALVVWAFTHELPDVFELFSWKQKEVNSDDQSAYMKLLWDALPNVVSFVGDVDGQKANLDVWVNRMNLPIERANKLGKNMLEELLAGDIRKGRVHFRGVRDGKRIIGSPLLTEMQHLVYLPGKPGKTREVDKYRKVAGVAHADDCTDAARYSFHDLTHHLHRPPPPPDTRDEIARGKAQAEQYLAAIDKADERRRQEQRARDLEEAQWGPGPAPGGDPYDDGSGWY